ncbi:hypothetical protein [Hymenobacter defluvii]|uniref:DUF4142 domain-containing protein n=1 Tax=Hymenobacter defluvii TaxID=2054411 RepID=A0ABS3T932_9BACT|nr:hypothetical protein [Hymenobacter defluvii]MBO3270155.1 hypothetical protein [Hymenobacter defluvii]
MKLLYTLLFSLLSLTTFAQTTTDFVPWSAKHHLTAQDFGVKLKKETIGKAEFQLTTETRTNLYTKQKRTIVRNGLVRSKSSINPAHNVAQQLRFQQTLFDITEIYARKLRQLMPATPTAAPTPTSAKTDPAAQMIAAAAKRRQQYRLQTANSTIAAKQAQWEKTIQKELAALQQFALPE